MTLTQLYYGVTYVVTLHWEIGGVLPFKVVVMVVVADVEMAMTDVARKTESFIFEFLGLVNLILYN